MKTRSMLLSRMSEALMLALLTSVGCLSAEEEDDEAFGDSDVDFRPVPVRICAGCTYEMVAFAAVPTTNIETATIKAAVTHSGACPQGRHPNNCTETLTYDVECALGSSTVTLPLLIDAASSNNARTATLAVKTVGGSTQFITGTVNSGSGTTTLPATPCAPPTVNPYVTLPTVL